MSLANRLDPGAAASGPSDPPPEFEPPAEAVPWAAQAGQDLELVTFVRNQGGRGKGFAVTAWGPAVDRGHLELATVEVLVGGRAHRAEFRRGDGFVLATFLDVEIPEAPADPFAFLHADAESLRGAFDAQLGAQLDLRISALVLSAGRADLKLSYVPLDNPSGGQVTETVPFEIEACAHRSGIVSVANLM